MQVLEDTSFMDNLTIKQTDYGYWVETYGKIDTSKQVGSCHYAQAYSNNPERPTYVKDIMEARKRFIGFYMPLWVHDNKEESW